MIEDFRAMAAAHPRCFWLDGGGARSWSGRRSIMGWLADDDVSLTYSASRREVTRHASGRSSVVGEDIFDVLAGMGPSEQWFGYLGYACRPDLPALVGGPVPDAVWMRPSHVRLFEHQPRARVGHFEGEISGTKGTFPRPAGEIAPVQPAYAAAFDRVQEHLHAGNTYEVNLTHRETVASDLAPVEVYERLRALNPAPYAGFLQHDVDGGRGWLLSSSPERYALVTADRHLETKPIKGTTPRGATPEEDAELKDRLAHDERYRAENLMVADLLRNDVSMVCEPGSVEVPELMAVESYETVHQLVTTVRGRLRNDVTTVEALRALFPAGSMTGAPKLRTMEVIAEVETSARSAYAGAFGWIAGEGRADLGVVIRSLFTGGDGTWTLGTGGGVTVHSDAASEWAETQWKAERLRAAVTGLTE